MGRLDGIEPGLDAVHVLTRERERPLVDLRLPAGPLDVGDRERLAEMQVAAPDRVRVSVERTHGRAGGAVPLLVVLAAVARAAEAGDGDGEDERDVPLV